MKKVLFSVVAMATMSTLSFAGGDIDPVEPMVDTPVMAASHSGLYLGLGLTASSTGIGTVSVFSENSGQDRLGDITFQAGYEFNPYIAVEGRYSTSLFAEDFIERDSWGVYLKPQYPVNDAMTVYALLGYGGMTLDGIDGVRASLDDNGFQWGLGASYDVSNNVAVFIDYVSIANDMSADSFPASSLDISSQAVTLGVTYKF
jgi:opacity protein-like surface antigen